MPGILTRMDPKFVPHGYIPSYRNAAADFLIDYSEDKIRQQHDKY
jgi:hypothetical protein